MKTMTLLWSVFESVAGVVVDLDFFDQIISNMDTPDKVVSQLTTAVQSRGARLTMASLDTFLAETTSAIVSALGLPSLSFAAGFYCSVKRLRTEAGGEDGTLRARAPHLP